MGMKSRVEFENTGNLMGKIFPELLNTTSGYTENHRNLHCHKI